MDRPTDFAALIFQYPRQPHVRRHGPMGYVNYQSYKPWLRDEFCFRCIYCLWRERWLSLGEEAFSVEHLRSRAAMPDLIGTYENLVYACCRCNSVKTDAQWILDPCRHAYGDHLIILGDGVIQGLTLEGRELIEICQLNRPRITNARERLLEPFRTLQESGTSRATALLHHYLSFPDNLPMLSQYRPPNGNSRPEGIALGHHELRRRDELPKIY